MFFAISAIDFALKCLSASFSSMTLDCFSFSLVSLHLASQFSALVFAVCLVLQISHMYID
jgi:hypothetical protein